MASYSQTEASASSLRSRDANLSWLRTIWSKEHLNHLIKNWWTEGNLNRLQMIWSKEHLNHLIKNWWTGGNLSVSLPQICLPQILTNSQQTGRDLRSQASCNHHLSKEVNTMSDCASEFSHTTPCYTLASYKHPWHSHILKSGIANGSRYTSFLKLCKDTSILKFHNT